MAERAKRKKPTTTVEEAIALLQSLGMTVNVPSITTDETKREESIVSLGLKPTKKVKSDSSKLTYNLANMHVISGKSYGPGPITLPITESDLFRSLVHQDKASIKSLQDSIEYVKENPTSFIEITDPTVRGGATCIKRPISEDVYNSNALMQMRSIDFRR